MIYIAFYSKKKELKKVKKRKMNFKESLKNKKKR